MLDEMFRPLRRYADFRGRARRREYWLFTLLCCAIFAAIAGAGIWLGWKPWNPDGSLRFEPGKTLAPIDTVCFALIMLASAALAIPTLAVQTRRFHDRERSAWMLLWNLVPWFGSAVIFINMVLPGDPDPNFYGPAPGDPLGLRLKY